jgi:NTE family protein
VQPTPPIVPLPETTPVPPPVSETAPQPTMTATPAPPTFLAKELPKVGVILGPGAMKAYAHLGVLRELQRARIPVHAVAGIEWGAVIGGLYSVQGQVNDAEWKAFKLRDQELPGEGFLSSRIKMASIATLEPFLATAAGSSAIERNKIPFGCPAYWSKQDRFGWMSKGSLKEAIRTCVPYPPLYSDNAGVLASPFSIEDASAWLKSRGANLIVLVNVLAQGELLAPSRVSSQYADNLLWSEIRREFLRAKPPTVNIVININTTGHPLLDYAGRRALMEAGSKASRDVVDKMAAQYGF